MKHEYMEENMSNNDVKVKDLMATNVSTLGRNDTLDLQTMS